MTGVLVGDIRAVDVHSITICSLIKGGYLYYNSGSDELRGGYDEFVTH